MSALKLSVYYGERDRAGRPLPGRRAADVFARHELRVSLVMRGTTGFGAKHRLRTDRLLTLSEDLPLVSVAVDDEERIEAAAEDVEALGFHGLVTLERARFAGEEPAPEGEVKLTVYLGRGERAGGRPAYAAVVDVLRAARRGGRHRAARGRRDAARRAAPREPGGPQRGRAADGRLGRRRRAHRGGGGGDRRLARAARC